MKKTIAIIWLALILLPPTFAVTFTEVKSHKLNTLNRQDTLTKRDYLTLYDQLNFKGESIFNSDHIPFEKETLIWDLSRQLEPPEDFYLNRGSDSHTMPLIDLKSYTYLQFNLEDTSSKIAILDTFLTTDTFTLPKGSPRTLGPLTVIANDFQTELLLWIDAHKFDYHSINDTSLYFKKDLVWLMYDLKKPNTLSLQGKSILSTLELQLPLSYTALDPTDHVTFTDNQFAFSYETDGAIERLTLSKNSNPIQYLHDDCDSNIISHRDMAGVVYEKIYDMRTFEDYNKGHMNGASHLPLEALTHLVGTLEDKEEHMLFYCYSGFTSSRAMQYLKSMGYTNVYSLEGGYIND